MHSWLSKRDFFELPDENGILLLMLDDHLRGAGEVTRSRRDAPWEQRKHKAELIIDRHLHGAAGPVWVGYGATAETRLGYAANRRARIA